MFERGLLDLVGTPPKTDGWELQLLRPRNQPLPGVSHFILRGIKRATLASSRRRKTHFQPTPPTLLWSKNLFISPACSFSSLKDLGLIFCGQHGRAKSLGARAQSRPPASPWACAAQNQRGEVRFFPHGRNRPRDPKAFPREMGVEYDRGSDGEPQMLISCMENSPTHSPLSDTGGFQGMENMGFGARSCVKWANYKSFAAINQDLV